MDWCFCPSPCLAYGRGRVTDIKNGLGALWAIRAIDRVPSWMEREEEREGGKSERKNERKEAKRD